jgi:pimeloyl-ACP methyl ester carboxylesterase
LAPSFRRLTKLPQPALVVAGEWDPVTPPSAGRLLAEQFSPGRLVILSKAGHSMEAASCLASMTRDFLAGRPVEDRCAKR